MSNKSKKKIECIFTIDAGTQSIRAALIDLKGNILEIIKTPIEPYYSVNPGWAEQRPEYYWEMLCYTCKKLLSKSSIDKNSIQGVTLTTQRNTVINVDKKGKPLRPAMVWLDQRKADSSNWPPIYLKAALKALNMYDFAVSAYQDCEANWIRQNQPEIWDKTHKLLYLSGYFIKKLTGEYLDSIGSLIGYLPLDYKKFSISKKYDLKWKFFPIEKSKLPGIVNPTDLLGTITKQASKDTGIPEGLRVIASAADKACEVLGSGCLTPEIACLSYGTTATVETTNSNYVEVIPFIPPYPSAVPGAWNTEVMIFRGYWMVSWFKREFGLREEQLAKKKKIAPEQLFDELIKNIPPGSMGLTLQPYWSPGVKIPGAEAKGGIIGFGGVHTRASGVDLYLVPGADGTAGYRR